RSCSPSARGCTGAASSILPTRSHGGTGQRRPPTPPTRGRLTPATGSRRRPTRRVGCRSESTCVAVTQEELYSGLDLELSWSERALPEHVRTKHVHRLHPYHGKFIPQLVEVLLE